MLTEAVGATGGVGTALTVNVIPVEVQLVVVLVVVTEYVPGVKLAKVPLVLVTGATTGAVPVTV